MGSNDSDTSLWHHRHLYAAFMIVLAGLAVYALVLVIVVLRLRIAELKRDAPPKSSPLN